MLKRIKSYILRREIDQKSAKNRTFPSSLKTICLYLDDIELKNPLESKLQKLVWEKWNSEIQVEFVYFSTKKRTSKTKPERNILYTNDFTFFLGLKSKQYKNLITKNYDLLINLSETTLPHIEKCLFRSKASFIIGPGGQNMYPYHDFMVNTTSKDPIEKLSAIVTYLV